MLVFRRFLFMSYYIMVLGKREKNNNIVLVL